MRPLVTDPVHGPGTPCVEREGSVVNDPMERPPSPQGDREAGAAGDAGAPVEAMTYTEASAELDGIVHFFEQRDVDVDQLVGKLVRATAIVEELDKRLRKTRLQVEQLVPRLAAVLTEPVEPAGPPLTAEPARRPADRPPRATRTAEERVRREGGEPSADAAEGSPGSALF